VSSGAPNGAFATAVIVFIPWNDVEGKPSGMVRLCPACQTDSVIGHGWRGRQAHDATHTEIRIQRGLCKLCRLTLTMLPDWLIPGGQYSLLARQQAADLAIEQGLPAEKCIPEDADRDRLADPSTVRRWFRRRVVSLVLSVLKKRMQTPTLFAWDWKAASRTLIPEANSA
jgi:hypothetical protein